MNQLLNSEVRLKLKALVMDTLNKNEDLLVAFKKFNYNKMNKIVNNVEKSIDKCCLEIQNILK